MIKTLDPIPWNIRKEVQQDFLTTPVTDDDKLYTHDTEWGRHKIYKKESKVKFLSDRFQEYVPGWKIVGGNIFSTFYPMALAADGSAKTIKASEDHEKNKTSRNRDGSVEDARFNPAIGMYIKKKQADPNQTLYIPLLITGGGNINLHVMKQKNWRNVARTFEKKITTEDKVGGFSMDVADYTADTEKLAKECNHIKKACFYKLVKAAEVELKELTPLMFNSSYLHVTNNWSKTCTSLMVLKIFLTKAESYDMQIHNSADAFSANVV